MEEIIQEILGWIIILTGVGMMLFVFFSSYDIFTAKKPAPEVFKMEKIQKNNDSLSGKSDLKIDKNSPQTIQEEAQKQMEAIFQSQLSNIFPQGGVIQLLNLISFFIFVGIVVFIGSSLGGLGIKLVKKSKEKI